jgi:uncharacterized membrane protein
MPFELGDSLKNTFNWTFQSRGMNNLFASKFYTTAILTVMVIILIMIIYPAKKNTPPWMLFKLGFYIFIISLGVIVMHDGVVLSAIKEKMGGDESTDFIDGLHGGNVAFGGNSITVSPNTVDEQSYVDPKMDGGSHEDLFQHFGV